MTVSTTTNRAQFNCNGSTTSFPFTFKYLADSDLQVYLSSPAGVVTLLTLNVDYEITPAIPGPGGTLSFLGTYLSSPPVSGYTLTILRFIARTQEVDFINGDSLDENNIEGMGDKLTMMVQDLDERIGRAVTVPPSSGISNISVPDPAPGAYLRWNSSGDGLENATAIDPELITVSDYWKAVIDGGDNLPDALTAMGLDPSLSTLSLPDNVTISNFIKTLLDDADAAAARATLQIPAASESVAGLAELATQAEVDAGTDDARIVTPKKLLDTPMIYRKNVVINGDMLVWQRGTTFAAVPDGAYTADRWQIVEATDAVVTLTKSTDVPTAADAGGSFAASLKLDVTTADTSIGSTQVCCLQTMIEGYDIRGLTSGNVTMSFWVKATKTGTYCVVLRNAGADRVYPVEYTINNTGTWEKKTIVIPLNTGVASGTWNYTNGIGLTIRFIIAAGSSYANGTNATWGTAGAGGTSNQVNGLDSTDNDFYITGVQLEKGSVATDFEFRSFATELALCQRYYEKSYLVGTVPGTATMNNHLVFNGAGTGGDKYTPTFHYAVRKRTNPTITIYASNTGNVSRISAYNGATGVYSSEIGDSNLALLIGESCFYVYIGQSHISNYGYYYGFHYVADAEM